MNKTLSIALAGFSFTIDELAYIKLSDYLNALRNSLDADEADEVMKDIEIRMVEIFKETLGKREVVNDSDVEKVIAQIGTPEQIDEQEEAYFSEGKQKQSKSRSTFYSNSQKQLFRDPENAKLGGVCAGLASYFGLDITLMRLIWIAIFIIGFPLAPLFLFVGLLYVILWVILPQAQTASDFLKMKGKPMNFDNLKEESGKIVQFANESTEKVGQAFQSQKGNIDNVGNVVVTIIRVFLGIIFGLLGLSCLIGSFAFFGISFGSDAVNVPEGIAFFLGNDMPNFWLTTILVLTFLIPAIIFTLISIKLFAPKSKLKYTGYIIGALIFLWFGLLFIGGFTATRIFTKYSGENNETQNVSISTESDSILLDIKKVNIPADFKSYFGDYFSDGKVIYKEDYPYVKVKRQDITKPYLIIKKEAEGYNQPIQLTVPVEIIGNKILVPNYFKYSYNERMRHYNANYELVVPRHFKVIDVSDKINLDDDNDDDDNIDDNSGITVEQNKIKINGTTIEYNSDESDSVKINGKNYSKDSADVVLERMKLDEQVKKSIKDLNINIKDGKKEISIKTK